MGTLAAVWGVLGVLALLSSAVIRLSPVAWSALTGPLDPLHYVFVVGWVAFMAYGEGYRGFQRAFSPRVISRAAWLQQNPTPVRLLLAPAFCMGFFHATRKRVIVSWTITAMVVLLIVGVKLLYRVKPPDVFRESDRVMIKFCTIIRNTTVAADEIVDDA